MVLLWENIRAAFRVAANANPTSAHMPGLASVMPFELQEPEFWFKQGFVAVLERAYAVMVNCEDFLSRRRSGALSTHLDLPAGPFVRKTNPARGACRPAHLPFV
ncbi:hypothetical protein REMIM1_PE00322 (plasmid) [Rhizobium etli bv. mimosae str. Mim1]|nr:hypothetical protein REMIM1_PE00322 [Rhizobium etli bv. mimosae str. Mim1]